MKPAPGAKLIDALLDASVAGSFTRIGYKARSRLFDWAPLCSLRLDAKVAQNEPRLDIGATLAQSTALPGGDARLSLRVSGLGPLERQTFGSRGLANA